MRIVSVFLLLSPIVLAATGCGGEPKGGFTYDGKYLDSFSGQLVQDGKPITVPEGTSLQMMREGDGTMSFNVIPKTDGSFSGGKVALGYYKPCLDLPKKSGPKGQGAGSGKFFLPGEVILEEGKTNYTIDVGKDWKNP
jgi:hypothetical protein